MLKKLSIPAVMILSFAVTGCSQMSSSASQSANNTSHLNQLEENKDFHPKNVGENEKRYKVRESISTFGSRSDSEKIMMQRANSFCNKSNKKMIPVSEHITNPPFMINHYPNVTLTFVCQSNKSKQINKKVVKKVKSSTDITNKYNDLIMLKKLLDNKILTQEEFNVEKKKILNNQH